MTAQPQFVIVGATLDGGRVMLLASKSLKDVELRQQLQHLTNPLLRPVEREHRSYRYFIIGEMRDYVQVIGRDYPEAFSTLFECWTPDNADLSPPAMRRGIDQRAIDSGRQP